jgi:spore coat protein CotH
MAPSGVASAQSAAELFDADTIHDIWLNLAPEDWRTLKDRYLEDDYYRADFVWNGYAQNGVGIRSRGSSSVRVL